MNKPTRSVIANDLARDAAIRLQAATAQLGLGIYPVHADGKVILTPSQTDILSRLIVQLAARDGGDAA